MTFVFMTDVVPGEECTFFTFLPGTVPADVIRIFPSLVYLQTKKRHKKVAREAQYVVLASRQLA